VTSPSTIATTSDNINWRHPLHRTLIKAHTHATLPHHISTCVLGSREMRSSSSEKALASFSNLRLVRTIIVVGFIHSIISLALILVVVVIR